MMPVKLVDIKSRKKRTELLLAHGKNVPRYIGDLGFELGFTLTNEERKQFVSFVNQITGWQLDWQKVHHDVLHGELYSLARIDKLFFNRFVDRKRKIHTLAKYKLVMGEEITRYTLEQLNKKGVKIDAVVSGSDISGGMEGTYKPSTVMNEFVYPYLKQEVELFKKLGIKYVIKHTDGNLLVPNSLAGGKTDLEKIIDCGVDAVQALDPYCMDIQKIKEVVLDKKTLPRICIIGGIDTCGMPLYDGSIIETDEDFINHVWYCLEMASINGGYIPGATNDVSAPAAGEKARAKYRIFCDIKKECGKYSLDKGVAKIKRR